MGASNRLPTHAFLCVYGRRDADAGKNASGGMTIELIGIITLLIGFSSAASPPPFIVYAFLCFTLLGSAAAFTLASVGGTNISPAHLLLGFLSVKLLSQSDITRRAADGLAIGRPGFWLLLTVVYGLLSSYFLPRIFAGQTFIFNVREKWTYAIPLAPDISNLTQSIYLIGDFVCFIVLYGYASTRNGTKVMGNAAITCVTLNLVFAVLDLATYFTNTTELLSFVRNANYALLYDGEVAGFKRIVGFFNEASSFSYTTLGYLGFTGTLWLLGVRPLFTGALTALSLLALIFSTSTTAYVGLAAFLAFAYLQTLLSAVRRPMTSQSIFFLVGGPLIISMLVVCIALNETSAAYIQNLLDTIIFNKLSTDSGVERSSWNRQAMQNFFDTFGFGVGNGSIRTSSFPIAVLTSFGICGTLIFGLFFFGILFGKRRGADPFDSAYQQAARTACVGWLIAAAISGALIDLGLPFFAFAALACSQPVPLALRAYRKFAHEGA
jgi:hypothetical protein